MFATLLLATLPVAAPFGDEPDLVVLKDGKKIECRVLLEDDGKVVYRVKNKTQEAARADVTEVQSVERSLREFLERFDKIDAQDVGALSELALFAESRFLPGEANDTWIRILTLDPVNEQAWTKLGGVKRRSGWELKVRGRFYSIGELRQRVSDWKNALELRTAHFLIETDAAPERALDAAIDLERAWVTFYDVLGKPLGLYVFDELPEIHIHGDPKDYPAPPLKNQDAWFDRSANTLHVNARDDRNTGTIVSELVDCLVYNSFRRTLAKSGEIEPWSRKGLAFAFAAAVRPDPGRVTFDFRSPSKPYFESQASDKDALALEKVLRAGFASFDSGTDAARYVAQSYTLVHFLVFYEEGKYRAGFANFLRSSYLGKGGSSNLYQALGTDEKTLESQWKSYVKTVAGV